MPANLFSGHLIEKWWRGLDSNQRRRSRQIYSLIPLATREPLQKIKPTILIYSVISVNTGSSILITLIFEKTQNLRIDD